MKLREKLRKVLIETISSDYFTIEMVFFIGFFIIVFTNFLLNLYLGLYFLGSILIAYSIFLFKFNRKEVK